jgi:hypothetical protein
MTIVTAYNAFNKWNITFSTKILHHAVSQLKTYKGSITYRQWETDNWKHFTKMRWKQEPFFSYVVKIDLPPLLVLQATFCMPKFKKKLKNCTYCEKLWLCTSFSQFAGYILLQPAQHNPTLTTWRLGCSVKEKARMQTAYFAFNTCLMKAIQTGPTFMCRHFTQASISSTTDNSIQKNVFQNKAFISSFLPYGLIMDIFWVRCISPYYHTVFLKHHF